ncbi:putative ankyrin repeat-containing protein-like [Capsicum annuum]|nr:putative ankyrin repeat-containing protein-like [Capsicum annuum]
MSNTILHVAAHYGHSNFVAEVLKITPALLCNQNRKNETVLHIEANEGHIEVVHLLFSIEDHYKEKLMRMTDENGAPTLHKAVRNRHKDVASFLVKEDPEFEFPSNKEQETPMYLAAKSSLREALVEILNSCKKPTSSTDPLNRTPLHAAVIQEHTKLLDNNGRNALHEAILYSQESVVNFLLKPKRDKLIEDPDNDGNTPLHFLASSNF